MSPEVGVALVTGAFALVLAVMSGVTSYYMGKRNLEGRLVELRESGAQDRATEERQYQLEAMKAFRQAVGAPKSQIIKSVHDLADRLRKFLNKDQSWTWTSDSGYFRRSFTYLIVRPFVWMEILERKIVYLDQTLGELVESELRFLRYCRLLEQALTDADLFRDTPYDSNFATAHVFAGSVQAIEEQLIRHDESGPRCIWYVDFVRDEGGLGLSCAEDIERIVSDLHTTDSVVQFRLARLVALYCAANTLLEHFALPFRKYERVSESSRYLELISEELRDPITRNLSVLLSDPTLHSVE